MKQWGGEQPASGGGAVDLSASIDIDEQPSVVFDYVMDVTHDAQWRTGVVEAAFTSDEPMQVGSTGYDTVSANGRTMQATWTVTEVRDGVLARWLLDSGPIEGTGGYICETGPTGTRFTLEADVTPTGAYRLLGPVFGMIGRRQNASDVRRLKALLESKPGP